LSTNNLTSPEPPEPDAGLPPPIIEELLDEVRLFFTTLFALIRHPLRVSRGWASGEVHATSPFRFAVR
jgi:hypothetical protein